MNAGIKGLALGVSALIFAFVPIYALANYDLAADALAIALFGFVTLLAIPCSVLGLTFSIAELKRNRMKGDGTGTAVAGLAANLAAMLVVIVWGVLIVLVIAILESFNRY